MPRPWIAFYAPMKAADHPTPSGDREIARLTIKALGRAGYEVRTVSRLRILDIRGNDLVQAALRAQADAEIVRLRGAMRRHPPKLWFTYHCHYKAPDLLGPAVSGHLGLPYVISEPSISPKRRTGPWAGFAAMAESAIARADCLFWTTQRDRPALEAAGHGLRMTHLPAFVDPGPDPTPAASAESVRLLTVAMMRDGDKLDSYRRLAEMLTELHRPWTLSIVGDGAVRPAVEATFARFDTVTFHGAINDAGIVRKHMEAADIFVWPGIGEGVGMVYIEAQAAGLPVIAEGHAAQRDLVGGGKLIAPGARGGFPHAVEEVLADLPNHRRQARNHILEHHSIETAATTLRATLDTLLP